MIIFSLQVLFCLLCHPCHVRGSLEPSLHITAMGYPRVVWKFMYTRAYPLVAFSAGLIWLCWWLDNIYKCSPMWYLSPAWNNTFGLTVLRLIVSPPSIAFGEGTSESSPFSLVNLKLGVVCKSGATASFALPYSSPCQGPPRPR